MPSRGKIELLAVKNQAQHSQTGGRKTEDSIPNWWSNTKACRVPRGLLFLVFAAIIHEGFDGQLERLKSDRERQHLDLVNATTREKRNKRATAL